MALSLALLLLTVSAATACDAQGTCYYVRTDGNDACAGTTDAPGSAGACAFRTIERCNEVAGCGDACLIGEGMFEESRVRIFDQCTPENPKIFQGQGQGTTWWMANLVDIDDGACTLTDSHTYRCPVPAGATQSSSSSDLCFYQHDSNAVYFRDQNGVQGDMEGPVCVTWNTNGASDVNGKEGTVYGAGGYYYIRPWDDLSPASADLWAPRACGSSTGSISIEDAASGIVIKELSVASSCMWSIFLEGSGQDANAAASHITLEDIDVYTGTVWIPFGNSHTTLRNMQILNNYRRPVNEGLIEGIAPHICERDDIVPCPNPWNAGSQSLAMQSSNFLIENLHTYASREGTGFSGGAQDGLINGARIHGHHNHGLKVQDVATHNLTFRDVWTYNSQETLFIECPRSITFESSTFPYVNIVVQGNSYEGCSPYDLNFYNNLMCGINWMNYGGDTWGAGGHDLDYNVYVNEGACQPRSWFIRHIATNTNFETISEWQNWANDTCADCTKDPHSTTDSSNNTWLNYRQQDDTFPQDYNFDLAVTANAIDFGRPANADSYDVAGVQRVGVPDAGAYENEAASEGGDPCGATPSGACDLDNQPHYCANGIWEPNCQNCGCAEPADTCNADGSCTACVPATETCDGADNDCDTEVDEGFDGDGDGYYPESCTGYTTTDCDDTNASVSPGASEVCGNGIDEDCDGEDALCPETENPPEAQFDFDHEVTFTEQGFTSYTVTELYTAESGYGWNEAVRERVYGQSTNNMHRDGHYHWEARSFLYDIANGDYSVTIYFGYAAEAYSNVEVSAEGEVVIPDVDTDAGAFVTHTFETSVIDGQLTLGVRNTAGDHWFIAGLTITPLSGCGDGTCGSGEDCASCPSDCGSCPGCDDGVQNGDETGVDCGGSCVACANCTDGIQNPDETGVDCGGSCDPCCTDADGDGYDSALAQCTALADCDDADPSIHPNANETCGNGIDENCDGVADEGCPACGDNLCEAAESCSTCAADCGACPTCDDGIQNGDETGIDCGGSCAPCLSAESTCADITEATLHGRPCIELNTCGVLDQSAYYLLTQDVSANDTCFFIAEDGTTLDLNGHTATYATNPTDVIECWSYDGYKDGPYCHFGILGSGSPRVNHDYPAYDDWRRPAGITVKDGTLAQGAGAGGFSDAIRASGGGWTIDNVTVELHTTDSKGVWGPNDWLVTNNTITNDATACITNRHIGVPAIELGLNAMVDSNTIIDHVHAGIRTDSNSLIENNYISHNQRGDNAYGVWVGSDKENITILNNVINTSNGRGILLDSSANMLVHGNHIEVHENKMGDPCTGYETSGTYGLRVRYHSRNHIITNNMVIGHAYGGDGGRATALVLTNTHTGLNNLIANNTFIATSDGTVEGNALVYESNPETEDPGHILRHNTFISDDIIVNLYGVNGAGNNLNSTNNTFERGPNPTSNYALIRLHPYNGEGHTCVGHTFRDSTLVDTTFDDAFFTSRCDAAEPCEYAMDWTLTVVVEELGSPVAGATVEVSDSDGTVVATGTTDAAGRYRTPVTEFVETNGARDTRTPHTITVTHNSQEQTREANITEPTTATFSYGNPTCTDGIQNQNETGIDCGGSCAPCTPGLIPACDDGVDNDGDHLTDYSADPGCTGFNDTSEHGDTQCDNNIDDDGDGAIDLADTACADAFGESELVCGNNVTEGDEECDDGNAVSDDGCSDECKLEYCGDGVTQAGEECDGGVGCSDECRLEYCGDNVTQPSIGETCDGPSLGGETCASFGFDSGELACADTCDAYDSTDCGSCDDGVQNGDEEGVDCGGSCASCEGFCGDNVTQEGLGEECDNEDIGATCVQLGYTGGALGCTESCAYDTGTCVNETCTDGVQNQGEEGVDCGGPCAPCPACGDGLLQAGEECDGEELGGGSCTQLGFDGGQLSCTNDCAYDTSACTTNETNTTPVCGDGLLQAGESCDWNGTRPCSDYGPYSGGDVTCTDCVLDTSACVLPACNDGVDNDGDNLTDTDDPGCASATDPSEEAACGNGLVEESEECDDGNTVETDQCLANCSSRAVGASEEGNGTADQAPQNQGGTDWFAHTSGGGGGGGGGGGSYRFLPRLSAEARKHVMHRYGFHRFQHGTESHRVRIKEIREDGVWFVIESDPTELFLQEGEHADVDLDGDTKEDMRIKLLTFTSQQAEFELQEAPDEPAVAPELDERTAAEREQRPAQESPEQEVTAQPAEKQDASREEPATREALEPFEETRVQKPQSQRGLLAWLVTLLVVTALGGTGGTVYLLRSRNSTRAQLLAYITQMERAGHPYEEIKQELFAKGWTEESLRTTLQTDHNHPRHGAAAPAFVALIIASALLITFLPLTQLPSTGLATSMPGTCMDSDGLDFTEYGTARGSIYTGEYYSGVADTCTPQGLREWYCSGGTLTVVYRHCSCVDGTCVE